MEPSDVSPRGQGRPSAESCLVAVIVDAHGTVRAWSGGAERLLGHPAEAVIGRPAADLLGAGVPGTVRDRLLDGKGGRSTVVLRHLDGRAVTVELFAALLRDSGAMPLRLLVATELPTESRLGNELKDLALDQIPFVGAVVDEHLRYIHVNERGRRVWNLPADKILGRTLADIFPTAAGNEVAEDMREAMASGELSVIHAYEPLPYDDRRHSWAVYNKPLKDAEGRVRGLFSLGVDTTGEYEARQRLALLNDVSVNIGSTLDVTRTAEELAQVLVPSIADFVTVDLLDDALDGTEPEPRPRSGPIVMRRFAAQSVFEGCPEAVTRPGETETYPAGSPHARAVTTGRSFISPFFADPDFAQWAERDTIRSAKAEAFGFHTAMVVPIRARGTTLGVAVFVRHQHPDDFDSDDLLLSQEITARAGVSLDNALRYTRQRATALTLQHSLLPRELPTLAAVEIAGRYLPSDSRGGVGGDWFDVIPLSGARVALVVGDVVGHGIRASATMGRLRTAVRTLADMELQPDELLVHLDDLVGSAFASDQDAESDSDTGATCLYAVYDPVSRWCTMARAGHPPPALVRPDGTFEFVDLPSGPPLGLGGLPFEQRALRLPEGSLLALYTDGLIESREGDIDEGMAELRGRLGRGEGSLEEICDHVLGDLPRSAQRDDVALLLARTRVLDRSHVASWEFPSDPVIVSRARDCVSRQLAAWGLDDIAFTTEIMVSELVTNAIRYGTGPIRLRLILEDELICEVADGSSTFPRLRTAGSFDEGGRGLLLVAQLSSRWGTRPTDTGKIIWADQPLTLVDGGAPVPLLGEDVDGIGDLGGVDEAY